jgi:stearoyl-CoA desaturase (Delta-9 desaturase)
MQRNYKLWLPTTIGIVGYHIALAIITPLYFYHYSPSTGVIISAIILYILTGISITAGYHRYFSHKTYKAHPTIEAFLLFFGTMAAQGSALWWSHGHRLHHKYVDTELDPYSIKKGFWHAHILWLFEDQPIDHPEMIEDLLKKKIVVFQDKYFYPLFLLFNVGITLLVGYWFTDMAGAFVIAFGLRLFALQHTTFFINSLSHTWGSKLYSRENSAVDNFILSVLTFGEGYHNYHHTFATDYRNGTKWYHFDPSKWFLWTLHKVGLAKNLNKTGNYRIKKRMILEDKSVLLEKLTQLASEKREQYSLKIEDRYKKLTQLLHTVQESTNNYRIQKKLQSPQAIKNLKSRLKQKKQQLRKGFQEWYSVCKQIMGIKQT